MKNRILALYINSINMVRFIFYIFASPLAYVTNGLRIMQNADERNDEVQAPNGGHAVAEMQEDWVLLDEAVRVLRTRLGQIFLEWQAQQRQFDVAPAA